MKNSLVISVLILTLLQVKLFAQKNDTIVNNGVYQSLYSYKYGQPKRVMYILYNGGGDCSRDKENFNFRRDSVIKKLSADSDDYKETGYDKGHMANAEDFAYDCNKQEKTFRFYNCLPQTSKLNMGIWKVNETKVREISQNDSLLIICGGVLTTQSKPIKEGSKLIVPTYCYKVVISLRSHKLLQCMLFENNDEPTAKEIPLTELEFYLKIFFENIVKFTIK